MGDWSKPTTSSGYADFVTELDDRFDDLAVAFDGRTLTNLPTGAIRFNSGTKVWEKWSGSAWAALDTGYALKSGVTFTGAVTFTAAAPTVSRTGAAATLNIEADSGYGAQVALRENGYDAAIMMHIPSSNAWALTMYDATGGAMQTQVNAAYAGAVSLSYAGTAKIATTATGVSVTGGVAATGASTIVVSSSSDGLRVTQTGAGNVVLFEDAANPDGSPWLIDASGVQAHGHTAAVTCESTQSASQITPQQQLLGINERAGSRLQCVYTASSAAACAGMTLARSRGALATHTAVQSGDCLGAVAFEGSDGASFKRAASIIAECDAPPSSGIVPGRLLLRTTDSDGTPRTRATITSAGTLKLAAAYSGGIKFPASQVAVADANTLDDYEEGTFTPTVVGTSTAGSGTYTAQVGRYTKVGNLVTFTVTLAWSAHTGTGNIRISGLPFTSANATGMQPALAVWADSLTFSGQLAARINANATTFDLQSIASGVAAAAVALDTAASITLSGSYEAQ